MTTAFVLNAIFSNFWTWAFWIILGGLAGLVTELFMSDNSIGCAGNLFVGILGGILGGSVTAILGILPETLFYTFLPALGSAFLLLFVAQFFAQAHDGSI